MSGELKKKPSLGLSLVPVIILIISLSYTIIVLEGSGHIPLIFGAVVAALWVDGEGADDLAGGGVDDADVWVVDEHDDAGSVEGSSESDVVHLAVDSQADASGLDAVVADSELGVGVVVAGCGFGSCLVGDGGRGVVWE